MAIYLSNRDGNGKTNEEGHYRLQTRVFDGFNLLTNDLKVVETSPLSLGVQVSVGDYRLESGAGYSYTGWLDAPEPVTISTADPANPRISSIVLYVDKGAVTSASPPNNPGITKAISVDGTPDPAPLAPSSSVIQTAVGAGNPYYVLADVLVGTAATQVTNSNITDRRTQLRLLDSIVDETAIADGSVTFNKLGASALINTARLIDASVTTPKIADKAVTAVKIADNTITPAQIEVQQAWQVPTLQNGWVNYGDGWASAGYYKDSLGIVHLRGLVKGGTAAAAIFTLPVGYRIGQNSHGYTVSSTATYFMGSYQIMANGAVMHRHGDNGYFSLDHITFKAEG